MFSGVGSVLVHFVLVKSGGTATPVLCVVVPFC